MTASTATPTVTTGTETTPARSSRPALRHLAAGAAAVAVAFGGLVGTATTSAADPGAAPAGAPTSGAAVAGVRAATARYADVADAVADGYVRVSGCEQSPAGAMGIHYLNGRLAPDLEVVAERPEVLLYVPSNGRLQLAGVEYFAAAVGQPTPSVLGTPLEGPTAGHGPGMPTHYDLHVWTWKHNPAGLTAAWNPALSCAAGAQ